jgi:hypothetical protein
MGWKVTFGSIFGDLALENNEKINPEIESVQKPG